MRITELQSVIAELTRKLNTTNGNMIIEEEEEEEEEGDEEEDDARSRSTSDLENQGKDGCIWCHRGMKGIRLVIRYDQFLLTGHLTRYYLCLLRFKSCSGHS